MLLSARWLTNVVDVNTWDYADKVEFNEGDPVSVYFQLNDLSKDKPLGKRYVPEAGATLQVTVTNLDDSKVYAKVATQVYSTTDASIWRFTISATDDITGTPSIQLQLTEGATVRRVLLKAAIRVHPVSGI